MNVSSIKQKSFEQAWTNYAPKLKRVVSDCAKEYGTDQAYLMFVSALAQLIGIKPDITDEQIVERIDLIYLMAIDARDEVRKDLGWKGEE